MKTPTRKRKATKSTTANKTIDQIAKVTSVSVEKHTNKTWTEWIFILKKAGAEQWAHREIVQHLAKKYKLSLWWQQIVATHFEIYIGKKAEGQNSKGLYLVTLTKTVAVDSKTLWKKLTSTQGISLWLCPLSPCSIEKKQQFEVAGGIYGEVRTILAPSRFRLRWVNEDWPKPSYVQIHCHQLPKNSKKSMLVISHGDLPNARTKESMRIYWTEKVASFISDL